MNKSLLLDRGGPRARRIDRNLLILVGFLAVLLVVDRGADDLRRVSDRAKETHRGGRHRLRLVGQLFHLGAQPLEIGDQRIANRQRIAHRRQLIDDSADVMDVGTPHHADPVVVVAANPHRLPLLAGLKRCPAPAK
jgi:hypothetical protein